MNLKGNSPKSIIIYTFFIKKQKFKKHEAETYLKPKKHVKNMLEAEIGEKNRHFLKSNSLNENKSIITHIVKKQKVFW